MVQNSSHEVVLDRAAIRTVFNNLGVNRPKEAIIRLDESVRVCLAEISGRTEKLAVERASQCVRLLKLSSDLVDELVDLDGRNKRRLVRAFSEDYLGGRAARRENGREALRECELSIEHLCSATLPAIDRANDEIFGGEERGDVAIRTLCAIVWREWQLVTETAAAQRRDNQSAARAEQVETVRPFFGEVLDAVGLELDARTIGNLISYCIDGQRPERFD